MTPTLPAVPTTSLPSSVTFPDVAPLSRLPVVPDSIPDLLRRGNEMRLAWGDLDPESPEAKQIMADLTVLDWEMAAAAAQNGRELVMKLQCLLDIIEADVTPFAVALGQTVLRDLQSLSQLGCLHPLLG